MSAMTTPTTPTLTPAPTDRFDTVAALRAGRVLTVLVVAFLVFDAIGKLLRIAPAVEGTRDLGFQSDSVQLIGALLSVAVILFVIPRTAFIGAVMTTAYLGGAVCANLRMELPVASHVLSPVYVALIMWAGLFLRSSTLRALVRSGR